MTRTRILLADDDAELRAWLRAIMRPLPLDIDEVASGTELLESLADVHATIDLVVTDVRMPAPDGLQVVAMARTAGFRGPILIITAFADASLHAAAATLDALVLDKPFDAASFRSAITLLLGDTLRLPTSGSS